MNSSSLSGTEPTIGVARVRLAGDKPVWFDGERALMPGAGSGIPAQIVDHVFGVAAGPDNAIPANADRERAIPVDQTHISVIVDERWVVKIVGAWGGADRSAAILERLRLAGSTAAPGFAGALEWEHPERGTSVLALVAEYVPESEDGWTWAVGDTLAYLHGNDGDGPGHLPEWPARVGELTAEMHAALRVNELKISDDAKEPRSDDREHATAVFDRVFESIERADAAGGSPAAAPKTDTDAGFIRRMLNRKAALAAAILNIPNDSAAPLVIPHGDLHVGQLLRTRAERYLVLDFDGDPQWVPERRLRADGAARDVAHMLVSIDLVAAVVQRRLGGADERAWVWGKAAQQQFLESYLAAAELGLLDVSALEGLVAEQLLIELSYAEHYLPEWRYAPDGVISRRYPPDFSTGHETDNLTTDGPSLTANENLTNEQTEPKWNPPALPTT